MNDVKSLDELYAILYCRNSTRCRLVDLDAPSASIIREDELIATVVEKIDIRIKTIASLQRQFEAFYEQCNDCDNLEYQNGELNCKEEAMPEKESKQCPHFKVLRLPISKQSNAKPGR